MIQLLNEIPDITFPVPQGAFYVFADFSLILEDALRINESTLHNNLPRS